MVVKDSVMGKLLSNAPKFNHEKVAQTVTMLLEHAHSRGATAIHIEPRERFILIRYRIGGVLRGVHKLPLSAKESLVAELKQLANLNIADTDVPQEGQYNTVIQNHSYTIRISTLPVIGGEKAVLCLMPYVARLASLEALGLWGNNLKITRTCLTTPHGLIIVAGPKRSGKTTTLYSLLHILATPLQSIVSIEDPIEQHLSGVSQTQVRSRRGIGFAEGLQAAVQQDANIIMLSSLTDKRTIELAVHAASGGHLIIAGVTASSAVQAILQLHSSGVQPYLLATALRFVIAQRLVRQLCPDCRQRYLLSDEQRDLLDRAFELKTAASRRKVHELEQLAAREFEDGGKQLNSSPFKLTHLWQANDEGCNSCDHSGYQGQIVLTEVLEVHEKLRELLQHESKLADLQSAARTGGYITLSIDGLVKALRGLTTVEELLRILPAN